MRWLPLLLLVGCAFHLNVGSDLSSGKTEPPPVDQTGTVQALTSALTSQPEEPCPDCLEECVEQECVLPYSEPWMK